ncbi:MAG TPA: hypothetical protein VJM34_01410 [Novosphingobium sp.]|nr:hypothetical protein [Novosphingobium sp.]
MTAATNSETCLRVSAVVLFEPLPGMNMCLYDAARAGLHFMDADCTDPMLLLARAAGGDLVAQRNIAAASLQLVLSERPDVDAHVCLSEGLMLARMAATHGDPLDELLAIAMLSWGAMIFTGDAATDLAGEALARMEVLADGTHRYAEAGAHLLASYAAQESPETLELAKEYRARLVYQEPQA